jgi:hypothetical protein
MKPAMQLVLPLIAQTWRRHDERAVPDAPLAQLGDENAGLNRLSKADFIREQKAAAVAAKHRYCRLELVRKDVDSRGAGGVKESGNSRAADQRAGGATPASRTGTPDRR